jgi:RNA polymerase primary sigma factor
MTETEDAKPVIADHLSSYFRDLSEHALLAPDQEKRMAEEIEQREIETWAILLGNPALTDYVLDWLEKNVENPVKGVVPLRREVMRARKARTKTARRRVESMAAEIAKNARAEDLDRIHIDALLAHLEQLRIGVPMVRNRRLPFSTKTQSFVQCLQAARESDRIAARLRDDFVRANLRLVVTMARRYDHGGMPLPDLIQEGNLGLMHAVSRFDHRRGLRFSTYACWWIRHAIGRALADKARTVRIPVHMLEAQSQLQKVQQKLYLELGRRPTTIELAKACKMPISKIDQMHRYLMGQPMSLDRPAHENDDRAFGDIIPDPESEEITPEDRLTALALVERVERFIGELSPIEADVIRQRFGLRDDEERTFREIGDQYHLSRERIRQIQNTALGKLREALMNTL